MMTPTSLDWAMGMVGVAGLGIAGLTAFFSRYMIKVNGDLKVENGDLKGQVKRNELEQAASDAKFGQVVAERGADRANSIRLEQQNAVLEANLKQVSENLAAATIKVSELERQKTASETRRKETNTELGGERAKVSALEQKLAVAMTWETRYSEKQSELEKLHAVLITTTQQRDQISLDKVRVATKYDLLLKDATPKMVELAAAKPQLRYNEWVAEVLGEELARTASELDSARNETEQLRALQAMWDRIGRGGLPPPAP
jgi:chromosome segregation ATPase